ncbi:MAG: DNA repair exonuclease [Candidatus Pacebacteria bacterium]|nr:DNA repair exonuclease [Candidatus Paceibacterota bacterium]
MTKILHTADLHLRQVGDLRWQALENLLQTAREHQVAALTIAGDLFDRDLDANLIRENLRSLLSDLPFKVIIIPGNHDLKSYQQGFYFGSQVELIEQRGQSIQLPGKTAAKVWGLPFEPLINSAQGLEQISQLNQQLDPTEKNILLFHGELTDIFFNAQDFGDEGDKRYMPIKLNYFEQTSFDYVLAGHFHTQFHQKKIANQRLDQGGYFVYPGSPVSITTKETGVRKAALIELGQPPQDINLNTSHFVPVELKLSPQSTIKQLELLEQELVQLPDQATALLKVSGYFDQEALTLTESQLFQKIEKLATGFQCRFEQNEFTAKDINLILDSGLYQLFCQNLEQTSQIPTDQKAQLKELLIQAMIKLNS